MSKDVSSSGGSRLKIDDTLRSLSRIGKAASVLSNKYVDEATEAKQKLAKYQDDSTVRALIEVLEATREDVTQRPEKSILKLEEVIIALKSSVVGSAFHSELAEVQKSIHRIRGVNSDCAPPLAPLASLAPTHVEIPMPILSPTKSTSDSKNDAEVTESTEGNEAIDNQSDEYTAAVITSSTVSTKRKASGHDASGAAKTKRGRNTVAYQIKDYGFHLQCIAMNRDSFTIQYIPSAAEMMQPTAMLFLPMIKNRSSFVLDTNTSKARLCPVMSSPAASSTSLVVMLPRADPMTRMMAVVIAQDFRSFIPIQVELGLEDLIVRKKITSKGEVKCSLIDELWASFSSRDAASACFKPAKSFLGISAIPRDKEGTDVLQKKLIAAYIKIVRKLTNAKTSPVSAQQKALASSSSSSSSLVAVGAGETKRSDLPPLMSAADVMEDRLTASDMISIMSTDDGDEGADDLPPLEKVSSQLITVE